MVKSREGIMSILFYGNNLRASIHSAYQVEIYIYISINIIIYKYDLLQSLWKKI